jgi:hypothetical protein
MSNQVTHTERKLLKVQILHEKAKLLEQTIEKKMGEIDELTVEYSKTIAYINRLNYSPENSDQLDSLMDKLTGKDEIPSSFNKCRTADQLLKKMDQEVDGSNSRLPNVTDNRFIHNRMRQAQDEEKKKEEKKKEEKKKEEKKKEERRKKKSNQVPSILND